MSSEVVTGYRICCSAAIAELFPLSETTYQARVNEEVVFEGPFREAKAAIKVAIIGDDPALKREVEDMSNWESFHVDVSRPEEAD